tara:strand:- start:15 stop:260 length:246 start_codon:yes stop_codon:yes gene_type:complete
MDQERIRKNVKLAIANVLSMEADQVEDEARFREDLELDSLARVEVMVEIERLLEFEFPGDAMPEGTETVNDAVRVIQEIGK